jgi:hypothetical protein
VSVCVFVCCVVACEYSVCIVFVCVCDGIASVMCVVYQGDV